MTKLLPVDFPIRTFEVNLGGIHKALIPPEIWSEKNISNVVLERLEHAEVDNDIVIVSQRL